MPNTSCEKILVKRPKSNASCAKVTSQSKTKCYGVNVKLSSNRKQAVSDMMHCIAFWCQKTDRKESTENKSLDKINFLYNPLGENRVLRTCVRSKLSQTLAPLFILQRLTSELLSARQTSHLTLLIYSILQSMK